jgi:hypothetical protein
MDENTTVSQFLLSQLLFVSGHAALKQLAYLEAAAAGIRRESLVEV